MNKRPTTQDTDIKAWFAGRLPQDWTQQDPDFTIDREEITVHIHLDPVELGADASEEARAEAAVGRIAGWREETREARMTIAREAQRRFERKVSWGATIADRSLLFTHLAVPVMTRLRQPQRQVLDTLVEAGVARSRADAVNWCVRLVGQHSDEWLSDLRSAMENVQAVREQAPAS
ncbi:MAG: hypothetical protein H0V07_13235 [Propionibacteriales bacterium]|nr:hypothetical protein [Propionibacteriales bacterium]